MPVQRGLVSPAIVVSTIVLAVCAVAWGALGVCSAIPSVTVPVALHRFLCIALATVTICAGMVNLTARILRAIRATVADEGDGYATGYAEGYREGVAAQPGPVAAFARVRR